MRFGFGLRGDRDMRQKLRSLAENSPEEFGNAGFQELKLVEVPEAKRRTPVEDGDLRDTVRAVEPEIKGKMIIIMITAGDENVDYAVPVHEDLDAIHSVGQAKYIESVLNESRSHLGGRIAKRVDLKRAMRG